MTTTATWLPAAFVERMRALLGAEADAFLAAYADQPSAGLRTNALKLDPACLQRIVPFGLEPVPWCPTGFFVAPGERPGKHPYHAAGLYYIQEPSAMAVVEALDVRPGQRVLDLAAAPGGKTTQIVGLLGPDRGLLVANEVEASRIKPLGENLERWGARNVVITNESVERLAEHFGPAFDRVLLDAPCSGEGMFRKNPAARDAWSVEHVQGCALRQGLVLEQAARLVAPDGLLVYSTCTFAPEENEQRIATFLQSHPTWQLVPIPANHGFERARPEWSVPPLPELAGAVRLWPQRLQGEGHFVALLRNGAAAPTVSAAVVQPTPHRPRAKAERARERPRPANTEAPVDAWSAFAQACLATPLPSDRIKTVGEHVYLHPAELPDLGGLRVVRAGLWLGTRKPGRFEPSHALALALTADDVRNAVALQAEEVERYLHGETLSQLGPDGWALVTFEGWPLGWERRVGSTIKNFYPKGLRGKY